MNKVLFNKHDILYCRECGVDLLMAKKEIFVQDIANPSDFSCIHPKLDLYIGAPMECPDCHYPYLGKVNGEMGTTCKIR